MPRTIDKEKFKTKGSLFFLKNRLPGMKNDTNALARK